MLKSLKQFFSRREWFRQSYGGLCGLALADLLRNDLRAAGLPNPLAPKNAPLPAKAKRCIFLFMEGGVSQMDTFDYKPALEKFASRPMPTVKGVEGEIANNLMAPNRIIPSAFQFKRYGESGRWVSVLFPHLATCVDDLAFVHGIKLENNNHPPGVYQLVSGNMLPGSPSMGAWLTYGLGAENQNLPAFIVLAEGPPAVGGASIWGSGYLPAVYQGTLFRTTTTPIIDLKQRPSMTSRQQQKELELLRWFNEEHSAQRTLTSELDARIASYEVAFRMQMEAPKLLDISDESEATRKLYGLDNSMAAPFARQCLLARRMVERGVRFVMLLHGRKPWDDHTDIKGKLPLHCADVDQPVAGLLKDLKSRGLLDETLVLWASEMGRTPFENDMVTAKPGRNHNNYGMVAWIAGGNVKPGATFGQTDDFALRAAADPIPMRDLHATLLRLMGLDQDRLTFLHAGRFKKLTDIGGRVINEIIS
jgi:hypothetical protein